MRSVEIDPMSNLNTSTQMPESHVLGGELITVAAMKDLAPSMEWTGTISTKGDQALNDEEKARYKELLEQFIVPAPSEGQIGCMDGRTKLLGVKTAGGTIGNAIRIMLASHADDNSQALNFSDSLDVAIGIDRKYGYESGSHDLGQCGAFAFARYGLVAVADNPRVAKEGTMNFLQAVGANYSDKIQGDIEKAAVEIAGAIDDFIPAPHDAAEAIRGKNLNALPHLDGNHAEKAIAVILRPGAVLDSGAFADAASEELGRELNVFGYNWDYHNTIASELGSTMGEYYLQSVTSQDVPILGQLTDGSLDITAYK